MLILVNLNNDLHINIVCTACLAVAADTGTTLSIFATK